MKITRKHFIKSPFLAISENYKPSLIDCFLYSYSIANFKCGCIEFLHNIKSFPSTEVKELPLWIICILFYLFFISFYPLCLLFVTSATYYSYATKRGIKKQKAYFAQYKDWQIKRLKKYRGWDEL